MKKLFPTNKLRAGLSSLAKCAVLCAAMIPGELSAQFNFHKRYDQTSGTGNCSQRYGEKIKGVDQNKNNEDYYFTGGYTEGLGEENQMACFIANHGIISRVNKKGELIWEKKLPNRGYYNDVRSIYNSNQTVVGVVAAGCSPDGLRGSMSKYELVRLNTNGNLEHHREYSETPGVCNKVIQVTEGQGYDGFISVGTLDYGENDRLYVVRANDDLSIRWDLELYIPNFNSEGYSIIQNSTGFLIVGKNLNHAWVLQIDQNGGWMWQNRYLINNTSSPEHLNVVDVVELGSFYYVLCYSSGDADDIILLKLDPTGLLQTKVRIDLAGSDPYSMDIASGFTTTNTGDLVISSTRNGIPVLFTLNTAMNFFNFLVRYDNFYDASDVIETVDGGYCFGGRFTTGNLQNDQYHLLKTNSVGSTGPGPLEFNFCPLSSIVPSLNEVYIRQYPSSLSIDDNLVSTVLTDLEAVNLSEQFLCGDLCSDVNGLMGEKTVYYCPEAESNVLTAACPPGAVTVEWVYASNPDWIISTDQNVIIPIGYPDMILRCYNVYGCLLSEIFYNLEPANPQQTTHDIDVCQGKWLDFGDPCAPDISIWSPSDPGNFRAMQDETYTVNCVNELGCITATHIYEIDVTRIVTPYSYFHHFPSQRFKLGDIYELGLDMGCVWYYNGLQIDPTLPWYLTPGQVYVFTQICETPDGCIYENVITVTAGPASPNSGDANSNSSESTRNISLYPNPTTGVVKVDVPVQGDETYSLRVVDMIGKELITKANLNESSYSLDISALPAGVYQVEVQVGGELIRKKLIKQ